MLYYSWMMRRELRRLPKSYSWSYSERRIPMPTFFVTIAQRIKYYFSIALPPLSCFSWHAFLYFPVTSSSAKHNTISIWEGSKLLCRKLINGCWLPELSMDPDTADRGAFWRGLERGMNPKGWKVWLFQQIVSRFLSGILVIVHWMKHLWWSPYMAILLILIPAGRKLWLNRLVSQMLQLQHFSWGCSGINVYLFRKGGIFLIVKPYNWLAMPFDGYLFRSKPYYG